MEVPCGRIQFGRKVARGRTNAMKSNWNAEKGITDDYRTHLQKEEMQKRGGNREKAEMEELPQQETKTLQNS